MMIIWFLTIALLPLLLLILVVLGIVKLVRNNTTGSGPMSGEEEKAFREMWTRLERQESRLGNLETILTADADPSAER